MGDDSTTARSFGGVELALTSAALAGDSGTLYRLASDLMDEGVPFDVLLFDYLIATERSVGVRWQQGDYLVAEEHAATAAIETVISLLAGMLDQPESGPLVVVATAEGDDHSLPARAVAAHLLFMGYRTLFLGANVPGDHLKELLASESPVALVVSATMTIHLLGARAVIQAAHDAGVPVVVGGKAFGPGGRWASTVGADSWVESPEMVLEVVEAWDEEPPTIRDADPLADGLMDLIAARSSAVAKAEAALTPGSDGRVDQRSRDEVRLLLATVEAGLLTGDEEVVADMLRWQKKTLTAHGFDASAVAQAAESALESVSGDGASLLARARHNL